MGDQFRQAIARYYLMSPGTVKLYPASFEDLLKDLRFVSTQRHLRKIYRDPMTHTTQWGLVHQSFVASGRYLELMLTIVVGYSGNKKTFAPSAAVFGIVREIRQPLVTRLPIGHQISLIGEGAPEKNDES